MRTTIKNTNLSLNPLDNYKKKRERITNKTPGRKLKKIRFHE